MEKFAAYEQRMKKQNLSQAAIDAFKANYDQLVSGVTGLVSLEVWRVRDRLACLRHLVMNMPAVDSGARKGDRGRS